MEIKINCHNLVELDDFKKLIKIKLEVLSYSLKGDTLNGDVKVCGEYSRNNNDEFQSFEDIIPFTLLFESENVNITKVVIENDFFNIIDEAGVKVEFVLVVSYEYNTVDNKIKEEIIEVPVEIDSDVIDVMTYESNDEAKMISEINDKLETIFNSRNNNNVTFKNLKTNYNTTSVYYLKNEKELEIIANERRISINELYKQNDDFNKTRRIIIHE